MWQTIGFEKNKKLFESLAKSGLFSHAYIFSGQEMTGKKTFALETARLAAAGPDILIIGPESSESGQTIAIEEVRKIKNFVSLSPYGGKFKFIIIDDAHLMTAEAQNALLKVLEEPGQSSVFILVTANPQALLPTVASRCQEIKFFAHSAKLIGEMLEKSGLSKTKAEFLMEFANGRIGLIKKIMDNGKIYEEVENSIRELMRLAGADLNERLAAAQKMTDDKSKTELPRKVLYWLLYLRTRFDEPKACKILRNLLPLYEIINKPQFNQRLILENFLVQL